MRVYVRINPKKKERYGKSRGIIVRPVESLGWKPACTKLTYQNQLLLYEKRVRCPTSGMILLAQFVYVKNDASHIARIGCF